MLFFRLSANISVFNGLDSWIRRRLRCYRLKQRKRTYSVYKFLVELGVSVQNAWKLAKSSKGWWRLSLNPNIHTAMSNVWFDRCGLVSLEKKVAGYNFN